MPRIPMAMRVSATTEPDQRSKNGRNWLKRSLSSTIPSPRISCPVECPKPHRAPKADAAIRFRPMVNGVRAAKWSGPHRVCSTPAASPVQALFTVVWKLERDVTCAVAAMLAIGASPMPFPCEKYAQAANAATHRNKFLHRVRVRTRASSSRCCCLLLLVEGAELHMEVILLLLLLLLLLHSSALLMLLLNVEDGLLWLWVGWMRGKAADCTHTDDEEAMGCCSKEMRGRRCRCCRERGSRWEPITNPFFLLRREPWWCCAPQAACEPRLRSIMLRLL
mmetsp:Transcript_21601/g.59918  ORF Transcript_21601/g.59918 Transcript_21601/m.59918 type:complete len:278 (-) Transcript_21601:126-959(-)